MRELLNQSPSLTSLGFEVEVRYFLYGFIPSALLCFGSGSETVVVASSHCGLLF